MYYSVPHDLGKVPESIQVRVRSAVRPTPLPFKVLWISRIRVLHCLLKNIRDQKKIDKHIYHSLSVLTKGNQFKKKRFLIEFIHELKAVRARKRFLKEQAEARKGRDSMIIKRKAAKEEKKIIKREAADTAATTDR